MESECCGDATTLSSGSSELQDFSSRDKIFPNKGNFLQTNVIPECGNRIRSFSLITSTSISFLECVWCISCYILQTPVISHNFNPQSLLQQCTLHSWEFSTMQEFFFVWVMSLLDIFSYCLIIFVDNCNGCQTIEQ